MGDDIYSLYEYLFQFLGTSYNTFTYFSDLFYLHLPILVKITILVNKKDNFPIFSIYNRSKALRE